MVNKVDSNNTGLSFAEEQSLAILPVTPVWYPMEPNSYSDFGAQITTVARSPINSSRQRKKGVTTDLNATGGFNQDLTFSNLTRMLQGFLFANIRQKPSTAPLNSPAIALTAITAADDDYTAASGLPTTIISGNLLYASGFGVLANNGLKKANATSTAIAISVSDSLLDEAAPPAAAKVECVGFQFGSGTSAIAFNGDLVRLTDSATVMTTLQVSVGEWVFIGGDSSTLRFTNNQGWARISKIASGYLEFDKVGFTPAPETGTAKTVQLFFGNVLHNEDLPANIVRRSYQLERTLGNDDNGVMSEYLIGAVPNELTLNIKNADKVTIDLTFVGTDVEQYAGTVGVKGGTRAAVLGEPAFNTSSNFSRIKLSTVSAIDATVDDLFAFAMDMTIKVNNNVKPNKAIGVLGAFDLSEGTFEVSGSMTSYFANVASVQAVRNNADVTLDFVMVRDNVGLLFDIPLLSLGDGRLKVEQEQPIMIPLETNAARSALGWTLLFQSFPYLPTLAA